jgi:hypothetical protein
MRVVSTLVLIWLLISVPVRSQEVPEACKNLSPCTEDVVCNAAPPRDCSLPRDNRNCGRRILGLHINEPACEDEKAQQNAEYEQNKAMCEAQKNSEIAIQRANCAAAIQACQNIAKSCAVLSK